VIRVLVTDQYRRVRDGLASRISDRPGMTVVATAATASEALGLVAELQPDVVIVDPNLPDSDEIDLCSEIHAIHKNTACIVHAPSGGPQGEGEAKPGARTTILKELRTDNLTSAIEEMAKRPD